MTFLTTGLNPYIQSHNFHVAYMVEGTELSSSSKRLSTLGRTSSIPRAATLRLGFSSTGGTVLPAVETPFSWIWWMTLLTGSGGAASSIPPQKNA